MDPAGGVIVVTGATRGIGLATARLLGARGAQLVTVGTDAAQLAKINAELGATGLAVDLRKFDAADKVIAHTLSVHGRVDAVIANAGVGLAGDLADHSATQIAEVISLNLTSTIALARAAIVPMRAQGAGAVVFVSSIAGALGLRERALTLRAKPVWRPSPMRYVMRFAPTASLSRLCCQEWSTPTSSEPEGPITTASSPGRLPLNARPKRY